MRKPPARKNRLVAVHVRLFEDSLNEIKRLADLRGVPYQIELRLLVRRALKSEHRELLILKEQE